MAVVGFIGIGTMGRPMAANLVAAGHRVRCFSRTAATRDSAREFGGEPVESIPAAVDGADVVITVLPDTPDVTDVATGEGGIFATIRPGALYIDMSTIRPDTTRDLHRAAAKAGAAMLDAPVSGGEAGAKEGALSIMIGGAADDVESARDLLSAMGRTVVHVGGPGAGQVVKAANQMVVAGNLQILGEALVFLRAHDADCAAALDVIGGGLAGSTALTRKKESLLAGDFRPGFRVELHDKDMGIIADAARDLSLGLPATALAAQFMAALKARGDGGLDHSALYKLAAELNAQQI